MEYFFLLLILTTVQKAEGSKIDRKPLLLRNELRIIAIKYLFKSFSNPRRIPLSREFFLPVMKRLVQQMRVGFGTPTRSCE